VKKLALLVLIMGVVLVSSAVGQEFTDVTVGSADPGSTVVTEGVYEITGNGNDIWDNADAFQYYYTELTGDGMMVARVVDVGEGSNAWAKGGVMIRQSTDAGSMHAITALTGSEGGGAAFQRRVATDGSSDSNHGLADGPYAPPYWVKTVRIGNDFTGYLSADGETWVQAGDTVTIEMADPVLIGLAVTSHAAGELRTVTFDNIAVQAVSAGWWPLNEGVGEIVADLSGNGVDGTINNPAGGLGVDGSVWVEDADAGTVISFDGTASGAYVRAGSIPQMTLENDFTWAFWAKQAPGNGDNDIILGNRMDETLVDFVPRQFIKFTPTKFEWHMNGNGDDNMEYEDIPDDVWLHHVVVKTADQLTYYRNGVASSSGVITQAMDVPQPLYFGGDNEGSEGENWAGMLSDVRIYNSALSAGEVAFLTGCDVTAPGDLVQGVPNDGDWPGAETPDLAIDDDAATKFLHFKGATEPTGIQVTPILGSTLVTGLTLTTANDAIERDPIQFELYGSNESIDGPYELITAGEIADFNDVDAWPRFTMNATAIAFENTVAYDHYQIMFPAVRDAASANSMQIAEVELIGVPAKPVVAWVSYHAADDEPHADAAAVGFTQAPDIGYTDLLKASGYDVVRVLTSQDPNVEYLSTFDLVIISRTASSGHYSGSGATLWNSITAPLINLNGYTLRNSRLGFTDGGTMVDTTGDVMLTVTDPNHPIFAGVELVDGMMVNLFAEGAVPLTPDPTIISRGISVNTDNLDEEGTVLATVATLEDPTLGGIVIAELPAGATLQNSSGSPDDVLAGPRLVFLTGSREPDGVTGGQAAALYDLYEDGTVMFLNAVAYMLP
jgi:concanavalin A-like lectin/glucanase superfamily protein